MGKKFEKSLIQIMFISLIIYIFTPFLKFFDNNNDISFHLWVNQISQKLFVFDRTMWKKPLKKQLHKKIVTVWFAFMEYQPLLVI